jgi:G patch domain/KOW motif-containing protein
MERVGQNGFGTEGNERENKEPKIKFGFSKIITNKVIQGNRVVTGGSFSEGKYTRNEDDKDFVTRVIGTTIEGSRKEEKKQALIIPLIKPKESSGALVPAPLTIGFDPNFSSNADRSTQDDYERVPVSEFGLAMLRGMGWKEEEGIGLKNKKVVELREPVVRPRGLGLGAERPQATKDVLPPSKDSKDSSKVLAIKVGAFAVINKGHRKGMYGQIESLDEDNNRVIMKLALGSDKMATISKFYIDLVDAEEFKKKSKVLNNEKYESIKSQLDEKHRRTDEIKHEVEKKYRESDSNRREHREKRRKSKDRERERERRDSGDEKRRRRNR